MLFIPPPPGEGDELVPPGEEHVQLVAVAWLHPPPVPAPYLVTHPARLPPPVKALPNYPPAATIAPVKAPPPGIAVARRTSVAAGSRVAWCWGVGVSGRVGVSVGFASCAVSVYFFISVK